MKKYEVPYENLVERNVGILSSDAQERIRKMHIGVIGIGGVGGLISILLAKTGFGKITVVDKDSFEISNLNRQILATAKTLGEPKVDVAKRVLEGHNPYVEVNNMHMDINSEEIAKDIVKDMDMCVIAVDNFETRIRVLRACKELGIPSVLVAAFGWKIFVTSFLDKDTDYEMLINAPSLNKEIDRETIDKLDEYQRRFMHFAEAFDKSYDENILNKNASIKTLAPVVNLASCAAVAEVVKYAANVGTMFSCPDYFTMDLRTLKSWSVQEAGMKTLMSYEEN